jgi:hypothetical protein
MLDAQRLEAQNRDYLRRLALNRAISKNKYHRLPVDDTGAEDFIPVGRGVKTSPFCSRHIGFNVCPHTELHEGIYLNGVDCTGKVVVSHSHMWCHKSSCPVCFIRGFAVREARAMEGRLAVGVERGFGEIEHLSVSVPPRDMGLPFLVQKERAKLALFDRGVFGAGLIPHIFRMNKERTYLVKGTHFHALGFVRGGVDVCRSCVHLREDCAKCGNFRGREVRGYAKDGYLVKCMDARKSVFGTAHYQLNHCSIKVGLKRFFTVTWVGVLGCSKLKGRKGVSRQVCPACSSEMDAKQIYMGSERIAKNIGSADYMKVFPFPEFDSKGHPNFIGSDMGGD